MTQEVSFFLRVFMQVLTFCIGGLVPVDAAIGVNLGKALGNGIRAAFMAYAMALVVLVPLALVVPKKTPPTPPEWRWWYLIGGVLTATAQTLAILLVPVIGNSLFFVCLASGQLVFSLLIDHYGMLTEVDPVTLSKVLGVVVVFAGVGLEENLGGSDDFVKTLALSVISLLSGGCIPVQSVINRRFAGYIGGPLRAIAVSFGVGGGVLLVAGLITLTSDPFTLGDTEVWYWFEWLTLCAYIGTSVLFPQYIGVAPFFVLILAGKLSMSLVVDNYGLFHGHVVEASAQRIAGCLLAVLGALIMQLMSKKKTASVNNEDVQEPLYPSATFEEA